MNKVLELLQKDQENIKLFKAGEKTAEEMHKTNEGISHEFLKIVEKKGFPYKNRVTYEVYKAGITLALHFSPDSLEKIFTDLEKLDKNEFDLGDKAYFIDRLRLFKNQKQVYGTQFKKDIAGNISFFPIEDEDNVDKRRSGVGLCTLSEYLDFINGKRNSAKKDEN